MSPSINAASAAGATRLANLARGAAPMTRAEARAAGLKCYFGPACRYGHHRRYVSSRACVTCRAAYDARRLVARPSRAKLKHPEYIAPSREAGRRLDAVKYLGRPHSCGSTVRYTKSKKCVPCACAAAARALAARAAR